MEEHLINDLGITPKTVYRALYLKRDEENSIIGITGSYIGDAMNSVNDSFEKLTGKILHQFDSKPLVFAGFDFYGTQVDTIRSGFELSKDYYIRNLKYLPHDCAFEEFRKHRALFSWLVNTRRDLLFLANKMALVANQTRCRQRLRCGTLELKELKILSIQGFSSNQST